MKRAKWLQETRQMRFEEACEYWTDRHLTQEEAASLPGVCSRTFRRYVCRYEEENWEGLLDRRMNEVSHRRAPVDEVMQVGQAVPSGSRGLERSTLPRLVPSFRRDPELHLVKELAAVGITDMKQANACLRNDYLAHFNAEFMRPPREQGCAFVSCPDLAVLDDILCQHRERTVGQDNCVQYKGLTRQPSADRHRYHYVKVKVLEYPNQSLSIHHGPREPARYDNQGQRVVQS